MLHARDLDNLSIDDVVLEMLRQTSLAKHMVARQPEELRHAVFFVTDVASLQFFCRNKLWFIFLFVLLQIVQILFKRHSRAI